MRSCQSIKNKCLILTAFLAFITVLHGDENETGGYFATPGKCQVKEIYFDWTDTERTRKVPVKIYVPENLKNCPVIIFSHGLGGSRDGYSMLGKHWASHGYVSVHPQHKGSDTEVLSSGLKGMRSALLDIRNAINRPLDIKFVIGELKKLSQNDSQFKDKMDFKKTGLAGHSFGANTTLLSIGQGMTEKADLKVHEIKAAIIMSAPIPSNRTNLAAKYSQITIPCMHMTGTKDTVPLLTPDTKPEDRKIPYDSMNKSDQYFLNFEGGDHMIFSGRERKSGDHEKDEVFHKYILMFSTAFWDAYLKNDRSALNWLNSPAALAELGKTAIYEKKSFR